MSHRERAFRPSLREPVRELGTLIMWTVVIGVGSGLGAVVFRRLIGFFTWFFFTEYARWTQPLGSLRYVTIPVLGALLFGPMIWRWAREARGHGVPEVMEAIALHGGRIRPVVAIVKSLASSIDIGSGGAVGREGPIAQIGAALGSILGQRAHLSPRLMRLLVAAGTAGGIAATFNAPIAGALFGMEIILHEFSTESFVAMGLSAAVATVTSWPFLGTRPLFLLPHGLTLHSPYDLLLFGLLGVLATFVGVGYTRLLYWTEDRFNQWHLHEAVKPAAGALLLGILITFMPPVRGLGYHVMAQVFSQRMALGTMALFLVGKFAASVLTLGSGGSGGIFTPTLYMGTMLGGVFGILAVHLFPGIVGMPAGYALVGAAAVFTAAARAPLTGVIIVMEMSQNYVLALPLIVGVVVATRFSDLLLAESIYTLKLVRRGVRILRDTAVDVFQQMAVRDAMITEVPVISANVSVAAAARRFVSERRSSFPVVQDGRLRGIVTVTDLERAHDEPDQTFTVQGVMTTDVVVAYPDEPLRDAVHRLNHADIGQLLVVDAENPDHLIGLLRRVDVVHSLESKMGPSPEQTEPVSAPKSRNGVFVQVQVPPSSPHIHHTLREVGFPHGMLVVSVTRGGQTFAPNGATVLMPRDNLLMYIVPKTAERAAKAFVESGSGTKAPAAAPAELKPEEVAESTSDAAQADASHSEGISPTGPQP